MVNATDLEIIENLRDDFRQITGKYRKKVFEKKNYGISFVFNRLSLNKLGCIKSIYNSKRNGFSVEEHFESSKHIKELFEKSEVIGQWYRKKTYLRAETIHLCRTEIDKNKYAFITVVTWGKDEGYIDLYLSKDGE